MHSQPSNLPVANSLFQCAISLTLLLLITTHNAFAVTRTANSAQSAAQAIAAAQPGEVIELADGLYRDFELSIESRASAEHPVTLRAAHPGKVILTGATHIAIRGKGIVVEGLVFDQAWRGGSIVAFVRAEQCRLTQCAFIECGNPKSTFGRAIEMIGAAHHNRIDHCYMQGNLSMGMGVKVGEGDDLQNTDNTFDHNYFRDINPRSSNGQESIQLGQGPLGETPVRATVEFNLFERASGDPEIISNKTSHNILRYNTFKDCTRSELVLRGGAHVRVEGNFFFRCKGGIRVHGTDHTIVNNYIEACSHGIIIPNGGPNYARVMRCLVAFNTLVDCDKIGLAVGSSRSGAVPAAVPSATAPVATAPAAEIPTDCAFGNNIIVASKGTLIDALPDKTLEWEHNLAFARLKAQAGLANPGITAVDPRLIQIDGLWRLPKSDSPALGQAKTIKRLELSDDIDGQPRKGALDIGCDQASDAPITRRPLEPKDVGPAWMNGDPKSLPRIENPKPIPPVEKSRKR